MSKNALEIDAPLIKGGWCHIYSIKNEPDMCAKVLSPLRKFHDTYPDPNELVRDKYGIEDFLEYEYRNYIKIMDRCPDSLRKYFVHIHGVFTTTSGQRALIMNKVLNESNAPASNLARNTQPLDLEFFTVLERIRIEVFIRNAIDHFGIMRRNILVQTPHHPVIIDFQTGRERFRGQFWLHHPWFVRRKVNRCFDKLYKELGVATSDIRTHEKIK